MSPETVIPLRPRDQVRRRIQQCDPADIPQGQRIPVLLHGDVTYGRLFRALAAAGMTLRTEIGPDRVIITDDEKPKVAPT